MTPIVLLGLGTALAWGGWLFVLFSFDPTAEGIVAQILFQGSFALALLGSIMSAGLAAYQRRRGLSASRAEAGRLLRQTLLFILFVLLILNMAHAGILRWWNIAPLALLIVSIEIFWASLERLSSPYHK